MVCGAEGVGETGLDEGSNSVEFLPWCKEGGLDLLKLTSQVVDELLEVRDVGYKANGDTMVVIVVFTVEGRDGFALDQALIELYMRSVFGHRETRTFIRAEL